VRPLYTGFPGTPNWEDYPSNYAQAAKAKSQGGFTAYAHPTLVFDQIPPGSGAREAVADVPLGAIDAFEVYCGADEPSTALWYKFLNVGFRLGITAGSDAFLNERFSAIAGGERVYVLVHNQFSYSEWLKGLREGAAFATVGPLLFFEVERQPAGHHFNVDPGVKLRASARAVSYIPMSKLEILANGEVIDSVSSGVPTTHLVWQGELSLRRSSWVAARGGPEHRLISGGSHPWAQRRSALALLAHSGPFYIQIGGARIFSPTDREFLIKWADELAGEIRKRGKFASDKHRQEVVKTILHARRIYESMSVSNGPDSN
jgi:hypothetical protein